AGRAARRGRRRSRPRAPHPRRQTARRAAPLAPPPGHRRHHHRPGAHRRVLVDDALARRRGRRGPTDRRTGDHSARVKKAHHGTMRPRFSVFIATSLDGYIARSDGRIDWLSIVHPLDEAHGWAAFFASIDTIVVGRGTYDTVLGFDEWPYAGKRVIVMTRRSAEARHGEEFFAGPATELAARLGTAKRVYIDGGNVIRQFFAADLVDDITLS